MSEKHFASGGVIVKKEDGKLNVLLIKDSYGHWTWPKGHIEKEESSEEAALREVREETGLKTLEIIEEIDSQEYWYTLKRVKVHKIVHIYLIKAKSGEKLKIQKEEIQEGKWFLPEEATKTIEYKGSKEILKKGIEKFTGLRIKD